MGVDYDYRLHRVYAEGRRLSADSLRSWRSEFERHAPSRRPLTVLDLGSGTGRFTPLLAEAFGGPVSGVEPSARMREIAESGAAHRRFATSPAVPRRSRCRTSPPISRCCTSRSTTSPTSPPRSPNWSGSCGRAGWC